MATFTSVRAVTAVEGECSVRAGDQDFAVCSNREIESTLPPPILLSVSLVSPRFSAPRTVGVIPAFVRSVDSLSSRRVRYPVPDGQRRCKFGDEENQRQLVLPGSICTVDTRFVNQPRLPTETALCLSSASPPTAGVLGSNRSIKPRSLSMYK